MSKSIFEESLLFSFSISRQQCRSPFHKYFSCYHWAGNGRPREASEYRETWATAFCGRVQLVILNLLSKAIHKTTVLTISKCTVQWHQVYSCCFVIINHHPSPRTFSFQTETPFPLNNWLLIPSCPQLRHHIMLLYEFDYHQDLLIEESCCICPLRTGWFPLA